MKTIFIRKYLAIISLISLGLGAATSLAQGTDTEVPSDVDNVEAFAEDGAVTLSWDSATDNVGISHYKIYYGTEPVTNEGGEYTNTDETDGPVTTHKITDLENGVTYYFALTAVDTSGKESEAYSYEQNATPTTSEVTGGNESDKVAPTVTSAKALSNTEVKVVFSEGVILPEKAPEAEFSIENQDDGTDLKVLSAIIDSNDSQQKTVLLTTAAQVSGNTYLVTAGLNITDLNKNPVESGTSDSATFTGVGENEVVEADSISPEIISASALSSIRVEVVFSEDVIYDSADDFTIYQSDDDTATIDVTGAEYGENDRVVVLTTAAQKPGQEYVLTVNNVSDKAGNVVEGFQSTTFFITPEKDLSDLIPPEDVTNFMAKMKQNVVELSWTASINSAADLADQILYQSTDKGAKYGEGKSLGPRATSYQAKDLKAGLSYTFKLTTKDTSGNESKGAVTTLTIPATGPGLGLLAFGSVSLAGLLHRRKKQK